MSDLEKFLERVRCDVDHALDELIPATEVAPTILHEAIRWSVFAGGKRVRPALIYAFGEAFEAEFGNLSRIAAAIEMIHTYSLIHDDLPAMDDDDLRRGRATCHKKFGEATAILAGDVLQTLAFKAIADDDAL
ncbi:MAG: polyprenyl synthetase family protein, partial [Pyrinomonadaceae bacterium]